MKAIIAFLLLLSPASAFAFTPREQDYRMAPVYCAVSGPVLVASSAEYGRVLTEVDPNASPAEQTAQAKEIKAQKELAKLAQSRYCQDFINYYWQRGDFQDVK